MLWPNIGLDLDNACPPAITPNPAIDAIIPLLGSISFLGVAPCLNPCINLPLFAYTIPPLLYPGTMPPSFIPPAKLRDGAR